FESDVSDQGRRAVDAGHRRAAHRHRATLFPGLRRVCEDRCDGPEQTRRTSVRSRVCRCWLPPRSCGGVMFRTRGLRHLALRVQDVERSKQFYMRAFAMKLVWQPDADNAYLSSGCDNLALHRADIETRPITSERLDHLGFIVATPDDLRAGYES